jgi:LacI family transcriptional regulator, galactose operon repressor
MYTAAGAESSAPNGSNFMRNSKSSPGPRAESARKGVRPVTIVDVASRCGVSIRTVSKVLNNEGKVGPATRARIQLAISALNFKANSSARDLAGRRAYLVALLYDDPAADYLVELIHGSQRACHRLGYGLLPEPMRYDNPRLIEDLLTLIRSRRPSGIVITPPICDMPAVIEALEAQKTPFACIARHDALSAGAMVRVDDEGAAREVTCYLLALGHRRIGFIKGPAEHAAARRRLDGFLTANRQATVAVDPYLLRQGDFSFESGRACALDMLAREPRPTAIFASNDNMAAGVLHAAHEKGLVLPRELSVVGFDDLPLSRQVWPSLTTVRQPVSDMAERATELVIQGSRPAREDEREIPSIVTFPYEVILRASTAPAVAA